MNHKVRKNLYGTLIINLYVLTIPHLRVCVVKVTSLLSGVCKEPIKQMCAVTFTVTHKAKSLAIFCQKFIVMLGNEDNKLCDIIPEHAHVTIKLH